MDTERHSSDRRPRPRSGRNLRPSVVTVRLDPRTYRATCVPKTVPGWWRWVLHVDDQGAGRWAVVDATGRHLSRAGRWDTEPPPPDRPLGWLGAHRFDLADALRRAARTATTVRIDDVTRAQAITRADAARRSRP